MGRLFLLFSPQPVGDMKNTPTATPLRYMLRFAVRSLPERATRQSLKPVPYDLISRSMCPPPAPIPCLEAEMPIPNPRTDPRTIESRPSSDLQSVQKKRVQRKSPIPAPFLGSEVRPFTPRSVPDPSVGRRSPASRACSGFLRKRIRSHLAHCFFQTRDCRGDSRDYAVDSRVRAWDTGSKRSRYRS